MKQVVSAWRHRPTHSKVWALAVPMILSNLTVPLVALVDSSVVGHLPYPHQLGAVAVGASFYTVLASMAGFLRMGTTGFAAQAAGRDDGGALRRILFQSLALAWLFAVALALIALPLASLAFDLMKPSAELQDLAYRFFQIRLFGLPAILTQYAFVGWLLGLQNARAPLAIMLATNVGNIVLTLGLVIGLGWGVEGAAIASVCAEWVGVLFGLILVRNRLRRIAVPIHWPTMARWSSWRPLLQTNRDIFIRSLALHCVFISITLRGAHLGDVTVAANALLLNGLMVCAYALDGLAHAVEALCGHAIGARRRDSLERTMVIAGGWSVLISAGFSLAFILFGDYFIALQTNMSVVRATAQSYIPYLAMLPLIAVWSYLLDGLFIGATRAKEMRDAMLLSVAIALPLAVGLRDHDNHGLWIALLAFMAIRAVVMGSIAWSLAKKNQWIPITS